MHERCKRPEVRVREASDLPSAGSRRADDRRAQGIVVSEESTYGVIPAASHGTQCEHRMGRNASTAALCTLRLDRLRTCRELGC